jgi:hypothetical protein
MFLGIQIPLSDARRFLASDVNRLDRPVWISPEYNREFVRGFGSMRVRPRGGIQGLDFEGSYCNATKSLRFADPLSGQLLSTTKGSFSLICVYRRYLSDGMNVGRFELGFRNRNQVKDLRSRDCASLIESLLALKVVLPPVPNGSPRRDPARPGEKKEDGKLELGECGPGLARYFSFSTTKIDHKKPLTAQEWWVRPGVPLVIFEHTPAEVAQTTPSAFKVRRFSEQHFTLYRDQLMYKRNFVGVWIIEFDSLDSINGPMARDLRICLARLHSERECLKGVLRLLAQPDTRGLISLTGDAFCEYLKHAVGLLMKRSFYGFDQSEILEAAQEFDSLLKPGERDSIIRELEKVPCGGKIIKQLRELTDDSRGKSRGVTNISGGNNFWGTTTMRDQNTVGQGVAGANAHVHDFTFQQIWNSVAKDIDIAKLADDLSKLRGAMRKEATDDPEQDVAIGEVAAAEAAAKRNDGPTALQRLKAAGKWALDVATKIGTPVAIAALKAALGL